MKYNVGSLFAGVGGICLGFQRASSNYVLTVANEWDRDAATTYKYNFKHNLVEGDIEKILEPEIIKKEQKFLEKRKKYLEEKLIFVNNTIFYEKEKDKLVLTKDQENIQKEQVKKLKDEYLLKYSRGAEFLLTENFEKELKKEKKHEDVIRRLRDICEYKIVIELLSERNRKWIEENYNLLKEKRRQMVENRIDILTAGFPCQAFSVAGGRKGFKDHRGELFYSVINWINQLEEAGHGKPRIIFLENVKNLLNHDNGRTFDIIKAEIEKIGYSVLHYKVLNTYEYTLLPQNRERIFVVCFRDKEDEINFGSLDDLPKLKRTKEELKEKLSKIIDYNLTKENGKEYYYTKEKYPLYFKDKLEENKEGINLENDLNEMYEIYQLRRGMYVRKNQSGVCPTLTANMGTGGHNVPLIKVKDGIRKLTPKDCFNLQGFRVENGYKLPPKLKNASLYKQAGNAVSVDIIELIARKIMEVLKNRN